MRSNSRLLSGNLSLHHTILFLLLLVCCLALLACQSDLPAKDGQGSSEPSGERTIRETVLPEGSLRESKSEEPAMDADAGSQEPAQDSAREALSESLQDAGNELVPEPTPEPPVFCQAQRGSDVVNGINRWREFKLNQPAVQVQLGSCSALGLRFVAPKGMKVRLEVQGLLVTEPMSVQFLNARSMYKVAPDKPLAAATSAQGKDYLVLEAVIGQSGENGVTFDGRWNRKALSLQIKLVCVDQCNLETTRFPTAFVHGFAGTDKYFGVLDYYYRLKDDLSKKGYSVTMPKVQAVATSTRRVQPLKKQLEEFKKRSGARKLNLVAHSQGGLDCRHLISVEKWGAFVASLTTVATPHKGLPVSGNSLFPLLKEMSEDKMKKFNKDYPNDPNVQYFSWKSVTCGLLSLSCQRTHKGERVDPLLTGSYRTLQALRGDNDGIVPTSSMGWGTVLGTLAADHWDQIGQVADRNNKPFNHLQFYHSEMKRLTKLGL